MWLIYAISAAMVWGLDYTLGERLFQAKIAPITLLGLDMLLGSIVFLTVSCNTEHLKTDILLLANHRELLKLLLLALCTFNAGNLLVALSIQAKNAALAGLIELSYPLFTLIFTWLLFKQNHFNWNVGLGSLLIISGVYVIGAYS